MSLCLQELVDMSIYQNRLLSFPTEGSKQIPFSFIRLAEAGFYSTGVGAIVKCFFCKESIYDWIDGDIPVEKHKFISPNCQFINQMFYDYAQCNGIRLLNPNTSMQTKRDQFLTACGRNRHFVHYLNYSQISRRLQSFIPWNHRNVQSPHLLVECGFFYTGKDDKVMCFFCGTGLANWDTDDDPWVEHARHSPTCHYLEQKRGKHFIQRIQSEWRKLYKPKHQGFQSYYIRLQTYWNWPTLLHQTPVQMADSGFVYTGIGDEVRCFYCGCGLRQWEAGDDPWTEHAKWFPFCQFISKVKGQAFIDEIVQEMGSHNKSSVKNLRNNYVQK